MIMRINRLATRRIYWSSDVYPVCSILYSFRIHKKTLRITSSKCNGLIDAKSRLPIGNQAGVSLTERSVSCRHLTGVSKDHSCDCSQFRTEKRMINR